MNVRRDFLLKEYRKFGYLAILYIVYKSSGAIQSQLMKAHFESAGIDLLYVLAVSFIPSFIYSMMIMLVFHILLSTVKSFILPIHRLEGKYFGLRKRSVFLVLGYALFLMFILYGPNYLGTDSTISSLLPKDIFSGHTISWSLDSLLYTVSLVFLFPLYVLAPLKIHSVVSGAVYALFIIHILSVRTIQNRSVVTRDISTKILKEGADVAVATKILSRLPILSFLGTSAEFRKEGVKSKHTIESHSDLIGTRIETKKTYKLKKGFYSADIVGISVLTPPFYTKVFRATGSKSDVTVIPASKDLPSFHINPSTITEHGSLMAKNTMGSSTDFAGIDNYVPGDPLNRIWWMSLAKTGNLLTKKFYSTGEDNIILAADISDPNPEKKYPSAMLNMMMNLVNICSRKDVSIMIYPISSYGVHSNMTRNKKELMFFLMNLSSITMISPKGAKNIFKSALSEREYKTIKERCKNNNITLSSLYGASGFYKKKTSMFSWQRKHVFKKSTKEFFKHQKKRSKIILLTNTRAPLEALEDFRDKCRIRKFRYIVLVLGEGDKKHMQSLDKMKERHILATPISYKDYNKMSKSYSILGKKIL